MLRLQEVEVALWHLRRAARGAVALLHGATAAWLRQLGFSTRQLYDHATSRTPEVGTIVHATEALNGQHGNNAIPRQQCNPYAMQPDAMNVRTGQDRLRRLRMSCSMLLSGSTRGSMPSLSSHHGSCSLNVTSSMSSDVRLVGAYTLQCWRLTIRLTTVYFAVLCNTCGQQQLINRSDSVTTNQGHMGAAVRAACQGSVHSKFSTYNTLVCPYLGKIRAQVAHDQLSGVEVAQRVAVQQRQLEEAWVLRLCAVQHGPCCGAEPAPLRMNSEHFNIGLGTIFGLTDGRLQQSDPQPAPHILGAFTRVAQPTYLTFTR